MSTIRRAEKKDTKEILELLVQVDLVHHDKRPDLFKGPATKYLENELHEIFEDDQRPVFVSVDENDRVQGYAFCMLKQFLNDHVMTDIKTLYIDDLCVYEHLRGRHIGHQLYEYVLEYAKSIGCYNVTLNVWASNESAIRFYEKCGLVPQKIGMEKIL
ncbi:MAG: GNAT family N-acetyltransferase [Lachnospiraceae bacterium]|nr:GNAT family N-acetyltransferase [Lachnospiraceae bacterium]